MGESGDSGNESDDSASDAEDSAFEFGGVLDDDTDISDVVDFSGGGAAASSKSSDDGEDSDEDESDPPDQPDPDSDDDSGGPEATDGSGSGSSSGDATETAAPTSSGAATSVESGSATAGGTSDSGTQEPASPDPETDEPDTPDTPDTQNDSGDDGLYDIDPVKESQQAFNFAESQSKAAYEFAYKGATHNPLARFIRKYTSPEVRERIDEVFSRRMLGSVLVGMSATEIIKVGIDAAIGKVSWVEVLIWLFVFLSSLVIFVWWEHLANKASEAAESAAKSASKAAESATQAAESATQTAEKASEAASEAAEKATGGSEKSDAEGGSDGPEGGPTDGGNPKTTEPSNLGQTAGTARFRRRRAPNRRPNKRFDGTSDTMESQSEYGAESSQQSTFADVPASEAEGRLTGGGFNDPGDAKEL